VARKKHEKKEGKVACKRKSNMAHRKTSLTMIGLGFFWVRIITDISL
jgi:hypothetical protein